MCSPAEGASARAARAAALLLALAWLALSGCAAAYPVVSLSPPTRTPKPDDYGRQLKRWTRFARIIKQLDTTLKVHATLYAPEFSAAYVARYTELFRLPPKRRAELTAKHDKRWQESYSVLFAASTHDPSWNDFNRKDSVWRIVLVNDSGEQVEPVKLEKPRRVTATLRAFFPYVTEFYEVYIVQFPRKKADGSALVSADTKSLRLRFSGPLGLAELKWRFR